eukprot:SAG11_NODE_4381_length_1923_cov_1.936404_1_plen_124_part_10
MHIWVTLCVARLRSGGMRSGSVGWLLSMCGFEVATLEGGYRAYRRWCKTLVGADCVSPCPVVVLGGCTGVGKTAVLHELRARGEQFLDLEGAAATALAPLPIYIYIYIYIYIFFFFFWGGGGGG